MFDVLSYVSLERGTSCLTGGVVTSTDYHTMIVLRERVGGACGSGHSGENRRDNIK